MGKIQEVLGPDVVEVRFWVGCDLKDACNICALFHGAVMEEAEAEDYLDLCRTPDLCESYYEERG